MQPGTPALFAGDEVGLEGANGEGARGTMPWDRPDRWDARTFEMYRSLIALRRGSRALREGGLRWAVAADDALAYLRETGASPQNLYGGADLIVRPDGLRLPGDGPGVQVWRLA